MGEDVLLPRIEAEPERLTKLNSLFTRRRNISRNMFNSRLLHAYGHRVER